MTVPFDRLGPGQVGRLAYQVIGSDGPINNPSRIRYLPPTDPMSQAGAPSATGGEGVPGLLLWSSAAQFATLGLSAVNLGVSLQTLSEVRKVRKQLDVLQAQVYDLQATIDEVLRKVNRIDVNVAEGNLRSALRHVMTGAITDDFVDLDALSAIAGDLDKFTDTFDGFGFGCAGGLKLSGDVRDMLGACLNAYQGARLAAMNRHNRRMLGSPLKVVAEHPLFGFDVESLRSAITFILVAVRSLKELGQEVGQRVNDEFFFADERTAERYRSLIGDESVSQLLEYASICHPLALGLANEIAPILGGHEDVAELDRAVGHYLSWWASGCDAHLVWSLLGELTIYSDRDFWRSMEGWDGRRDNAGRD